MTVRQYDRNGVEIGADINAEAVKEWIGQTGKWLLSLPGGGYSPRLQVGGMDVVRNYIEAYGWTDIELKPPRPSPAEIDLMDKRLAWMRFIPDDRYVLRRIVGARMLINPITDKNIYSWRRIGKLLSCHHTAVERWHDQGLDFIVAGLRRENISTNQLPFAPEFAH